MIKQKKRWVLVADGGRGRIFVMDNTHLENAFGQDFVGERLKESELGSGPPGRAFESGYSGRHAYQPHTDWKQHQKDVFAKELCDILEKANDREEFDELIVVAPPKSLGDIREHLSKQVLSKVILELPKDITKFTEFELMNYLEKEMELK